MDVRCGFRDSLTASIACLFHCHAPVEPLAAGFYNHRSDNSTTTDISLLFLRSAGQIRGEAVRQTCGSEVIVVRDNACETALAERLFWSHIVRLFIKFIVR